MYDSIKNYHESFPNVNSIEAIPSLIDGQFTVQGMGEMIKDVTDQFFITNEFSNNIDIPIVDDDGTALIDLVSIEENQSYLEGRTNSIQGVYFVDARLEVNGSELRMPMACKPFGVGERDNAIREFAGMLEGYRDPYLQTFEPIGFWVDSKGQATLLSHYEENVQSLDNTNWEVVEDDKIIDIFDPLFALDAAATILGYMHSRGFVHKDAGAKNMAVEKLDDGRIKKVRLIDIPNMEQYTEENDWHRWVGDDLRTFVGSVRGSDFLKTSDPEKIDRLISSHFLGKHFCILLHPATQIDLNPSEVDRLQQTYSDLLA